MDDRENIVRALKDSLRNQHCGFIEGVGNVYAVSEETINDTLELLKEQESIIESLESDLHETLEVVSGRLNVVRCKDCGNRECDGRAGTVVCGITGESHSRLWFCADGERRET